ncbi:hypothetical protein F511_10197 [Dorcoceras hygrometricum]|uniref:Uncharacterized protein n=1 Tax=Dorcoceras hygrometricum TaxID=472368 RepID=A0A2Z7D963_9LAMI|nr:hypothetical protein F511_10197 [Dorcoceras hygrometricum]
MAQQVDAGGNFWLPSEFLTDDELLMGFKMKTVNDFRSRYANSFGHGSGLSSPAESFLAGSAETESDEDYYVMWLTQKLAYAALRDSNVSAENTMGCKLSGSPQSTLCSSVTGRGCGCMPGLSRVSRLSLPPETENAAAWHSLLAAVERRARMKLIEETAAFRSGNPFARSRKSVTIDPITGSGFNPNPSRVSYQQLQASQFQQLKQQQQPDSYWDQQGKIAHQQMVRNVKQDGACSGNQSSSMASWLDTSRQPQQQLSSGMKAVFLGESETKSKRTGTGVFLPRNPRATPVETRTQTGCPVLLPDRVVQALNLNLNLKSMEFQQPRSLTKSSDLLEANAALKHENTVSISSQRRALGPVTPARMNQEIKLPQEWTY